eukprot:g78974.t1
MRAGMKRGHDQERQKDMQKRPKSDKALFELRLLVPSRKCGSIIGKKGATVASITEATGTFVDVQRTEYPGQEERLVTIRGDHGAVGEAVASILEAMDSQQQTDSREDVSLQLLVHKDHGGPIIGKGGATINEMTATTGAKIKFSKEVFPHSTDKLVTVNGRMEQVQAVVKAILEKIHAAPLPIGTREIKYVPSVYDAHLQAPPSRQTLLPGLAGHIERERYYEQQRELPPVSRDYRQREQLLPMNRQYILGSGSLSVQDREPAPRYVREGRDDHLLRPGFERTERYSNNLHYDRDWQRQSQPLFGREQDRHPPDPRPFARESLIRHDFLRNSKRGEFTANLDVPVWAAGVIIGKAGSTVAELERKSESSITFDKQRDGADTRKVTLKGPSEGISIALRFIRECVEKESKLRGVQTEEVSKTVSLSADQVGSVIGKGGSTISQLSADSGCHVNIPKEVINGQRSAIISGTPTSVQIFTILMEQLLQDNRR